MRANAPRIAARNDQSLRAREEAKQRVAGRIELRQQRIRLAVHGGRDVEPGDLRAARPVGVEAFGAAVELERDAVRDAPAILELRERDVVTGRDPKQRHALAVDWLAPAPRPTPSVAASRDFAASASAASQRDATGVGVAPRPRANVTSDDPERALRRSSTPHAVR